MFFGFGSKIDPHVLRKNDPYEQDFYNYSGRVGPLNIPIVTNVARLAVIIVGGQSQGTNVGATPRTVANASALLNLSIDNGAMYQAKDPLLSCSKDGANFATILGDNLITHSKYDAVVLVPIGIGATPIGAWKKGGVLSHRIGVASSRILSAGLAATHILWKEGESDNLAGTTQANYAAGLLDVKAQFVESGISAPMWVSRQTWVNGVTSAAIRAAQAGVVDGINFKAGPDFDTLNATYRDAGNTDFNDTGIAQVATMWEAVLTA